jgi:pimeloyl-[acyl-carrier protein] synthase
MTTPYEVYDAIRSESPCQWDVWAERWLVTGYDEVNTLLLDSRLDPTDDLVGTAYARRVHADAVTEESPTDRALRELLTDQVELCSASKHARLRAFLAPAFDRKVMATTRELVDATVHQLLNSIASETMPDLISKVAHPLPLAVMPMWLGIPASDREEFVALCEYIILLSGARPIGASVSLSDVETAVNALTDYLWWLVRYKSGLMVNTAFSRIGPAATGQTLSYRELTSNILFVYAAGIGTTANLIGGALLALLELQSGERDDLLQAGERGIRLFVEESLPWESPAQILLREATGKFEVAGSYVTSGEQLALVVGAANRDPKRFDNPHEFLWKCPRKAHLAFGIGPHHCLGAPLARLQAQSVCSAFLTRFPQARVAPGKMSWKPNTSFRGLRSLEAVLQ